MAGSGKLQSDPLYQGLTRPPMAFGVTYLFFIFNGMFSLIAFIWLKKFIACLFVALVVHGLGYLVCLREPRAMELFILKMNKGTKSFSNRKFHGYTNSYDIF